MEVSATTQKPETSLETELSDGIRKRRAVEAAPIVDQLKRLLGEVVIRHITEGFQDSIELGTPAKGGAVKVYGDFSRPEQFEAKIQTALMLKQKYGQ